MTLDKLLGKPLAVGQILLWKDYDFHNGSPNKDKFFVVLSIKEKAIIAITTSQQHNRQNGYGCKEEGKYFMMPKGKVWFEKDTWVLLREFKIFALEDIKTLIDGGKIIQHTILPLNEANSIRNCLKYSYDTSAVIAEMLS